MLLDLIQKINDKYGSDIIAGYSVDYFEESIRISDMREVGHTVSYNFSTYPIETDSVEYDPRLVKAEAFARKVLEEGLK